MAPLHLIQDDALKADFAAAVAAWRVEDMADFDEQLASDGDRAELADELENWRAKADPANWQAEPTGEPGAFSVGYVPPGPLSEGAAEAVKRKEEMEEGTPLLDWAFGNARSGVARKGQTFMDALLVAKAMDAPDLFAHALDLHPGYAIRAQGVAAVAAALATHAAPEVLAGEIDWVVSVLGRAALVDHAASALHFEETALDDDAAASAGRGLGALAMRGLADADQLRIWLGLVASPFRDIAKAALEPAAAFAQLSPSAAAAAALSVSATSMLYAWEPYGRGIEGNMRAARAARCLDAIDAAITAHAEGRVEAPSFPRLVTEHFVGGGRDQPLRGRSAGPVRPLPRLGRLVAARRRGAFRCPPIRDALLGYVSDALAWYASYMEFQDARGLEQPGAADGVGSRSSAA